MPKALKVCSWNICGVRDKFESTFLLNYAHSFDILWLSEVKTGLSVYVPGFVTYQNINKDCSHRGGIVLLVKHSLVKYVKMVDVSEPGQIWLYLTICPKLALGSCYMPPIDSLYSEPSLLGNIQAKLFTTRKITILIGDMNARVWDLTELNELLSGTNAKYEHLSDMTTNEQGRQILQMCKETKMVVVNHLNEAENSRNTELSFRKKQRWISELDICIADKKALPIITRLRTEQSLRMPSDHAPLEMNLQWNSSFAQSEELAARSEALGAYKVKPRPLIQRGPPIHSVNENAFTNFLQQSPLPNYESFPDIEASITWLNELMNTAAKQACMVRHNNQERWDPQQDRWCRLINQADERTIWRAIGWNGALTDHNESDTPSDEDFKAHFEALLKRQNPHDDPRQFDTTHSPYIPVLDENFTAVEVEKAIKSVKNKAFIGVCAGLFKWIPLGLSFSLPNCLMQFSIRHITQSTGVSTNYMSYSNRELETIAEIIEESVSWTC